jgi:hypothetical protein
MQATPRQKPLQRLARPPVRLPTVSANSSIAAMAATLLTTFTTVSTQGCIAAAIGAAVTRWMGWTICRATSRARPASPRGCSI